MKFNPLTDIDVARVPRSVLRPCLRRVRKSARAAYRPWHPAIFLVLACSSAPAQTAPPQAATQSAAPSAAPNEAALAREAGVSVRVYELDRRVSALPTVVEGQTPNRSLKRADVNLQTLTDFGGGQEDNFVTEISGFINIKEPGRYTFRLSSDDGSVMWLGKTVAVSHDGLHGSELPQDGSPLTLAAGEHPFVVRHFEAGGGQIVRLQWRTPGKTEFVDVPAGVFTTPANEVRVTSPGPKKVIVRGQPERRPGDTVPLTAVHPAMDLFDSRPDGFEPKVGGIDFLPDGRLILCTWDPTGGVYILDNVTGNDRSKITAKRFAAGLAEPLGIKVVDGRVFVLQKQELTELIDHDSDGVADEYRCVSADWNVTSNFHEFAFGLVYKDGWFYANLAVAINPGGATTEQQVKGRGTCIRIRLSDGKTETFATGLRTPNGIALGPDGMILVADNQGDWLPSSKLLDVQQGQFYNAHLNPDHENANLPPRPPIVWLPQNDIGNSPSEPLLLTRGPYAGQVVVGDVTHGGLNRAFVEKVNGQWQGAVFQFTQGLDGGVNRVKEGPDGALYVGQIGSSGNWGQAGKKSFGLQRLGWNGKTAFEMLAVRAMKSGVEIELTEPLAADSGNDPADYTVQTWHYEPSKTYGGPKVNPRTIEVPSVGVSVDRKKVFIPVNGMKKGDVVYLRLSPYLKSATGREPWVTEAWYTLNEIPTDRDGAAPPPATANVLSDADVAAGWKLLFDGKSTDAWRGYRSQTFPKGWTIEDGAIARTAGGGDIITDESFTNFELELDWKISPGGNSGIFYRVSEDLDTGWKSGPEYQILDDALHADGGNPLTSAGAAYAVIPPSFPAARPVGQWNRTRLIVNGDHVEHWLNGAKVVEYEFGSDAWKGAVAKGKFKDVPRYGKEKQGHIVLQDHGDWVAYRNIRVRKLD